jgi:outer membrane protein OmpA-like peptidoglycan-associated protein
MRRRSFFALAASALALAAVPTASQAKDQTFMVFFQSWSAAFDQQAQDVLKTAIAAAKAAPAARIDVRGYASTIGGREANVFISLARAQQVVDALVEAGIAASRITRIGQGEVEFLPDPQANRRVDIKLLAP